MTPSVLVDRYFRLASRAESDSYLAQFTPDADVEDEGHVHHGVAAIKAWRDVVPAVEFGVRDIVADGGGHVARTEISGDFPGSPVTLSFRFSFTADGHIESLAIRS